MKYQANGVIKTAESVSAPVPPEVKPASIFNEDLRDFSLVLGGPLFQLLRRTHFARQGLELLHWRMAIAPLVTWLPLLLLATLGSSTRSGSQLSFLRDVEVHVRFLVALPVLIGAERLVHARVRPVVQRFIDAGIVLPEDFPRFDKAIARAVKLRNSIAAEVVLLLCVYTFGLLLWSSRIALHAATWYAMPGGRWNLTPAGYWYVFVSLPIAQFVLIRWYLRLFIWFRFLWHVCRMNLNLISTHPDRCAGLAFLGKSSYAFAPILFAQGTMLAGVVASRVLYNDEHLLSFKFQIGAFVAFFVLAVLGPLIMFTPRLARARRQGLAEYGLLAQRYVEQFHKKWVVRGSAASEELLGSGDIQSLADLGNSYGLVRDMRPVPFGLDDIYRLAVATAAPFGPLLFTIFSPEELIIRIAKVLF